MRKKEGMPEIVYIGLMGINSRHAAYAYVFLCLVVSISCFVYGFVDPVFFFGASLAGAAYWYYYCIKWVDSNSSWD